MTIQAPQTQYAVQLTGPSELRLNKEKAVPAPGPRQMLIKINALGLCFSDLKLLKQFNQHVRKSEVVSGLSPEVLAQIPGYVPGDAPTVPGHEMVGTIISVGDEITEYKPGERYLIQPDMRNILTAGSNSAIGYNFEGGLQEYVVIDERMILEPSGERLLLPIEEQLSSSQAALAEPWACVEDSYVFPERQTVKKDGKMIVAIDEGHKVVGLAHAIGENKPASITVVGANNDQLAKIKEIGCEVIVATSFDELKDESFDDIIAYTAKKETLEALNSKLANRAIMNVVLAGKKIGELVEVGVGRLHYGCTRWVGTLSDCAAASYEIIPETGEVRDNDSIIVVGAGGPMGQMHTIRNVCSGKKDITVIATDFDDARLESLAKKAAPMADKASVTFRTVNPQKEQLKEEFSYWAVMAPVPALLVQAIDNCKPNGMVNIFAGIPAPVKHPIDLDAVIEKKIFLYGTSGSTLEDIKIILGKITSGQLNTNTSVDAICGMEGAIEGIAAVENRTMAGKIIVYPMLHDTGLIPLSELHKHFPTVAAKLEDGQWNKAAEDELMKIAYAK